MQNTLYSGFGSLVVMLQRLEIFNLHFQNRNDVIFVKSLDGKLFKVLREEDLVLTLEAI